jgi:cytochrome oxidase assembly protein ShyY1
MGPGWLALHAATVAVVVGFGVLGWWQVGAYQQQSAPGRAPAPAETAVPLTSVLPAGGRVTEDLDGRLVSVQGRYEAGAQVVVPGRRLGDRTGFAVVTPLRTAAGVVVVERGWVPEPDAAAAGLPAGPVTVIGVLRGNEPDTGARGRTVAGVREIAGISTAELLRALPYPPAQVLDGHVSLTAQHPAAAGAPQAFPPEPRQVRGVSAWRNLSYAAQWWLFAAAAVFLWWSVARRPRG